jgi:putative endonuclease
MGKKQPSVYIMASQPNGTLYVGVTSNIVQRVWQHKNNIFDGFSSRYQTHLLVYFEELADMRAAIKREKQLKHWSRKWKLSLIEEKNPRWQDLWDEIVF